VLFHQLLGKCQGNTRKDKARPALLLISELCCSLYCVCVNVYCHRVTTQLQLINISFHFTPPHPTTIHYTCHHFYSSHLNFTQLHFTTLSFGLTSFKFPTTLFHFNSLLENFLHLPVRRLVLPA
jgi:hypothetical protein